MKFCNRCVTNKEEFEFSKKNRNKDDGMSWENWGEWHINHIIPISKFDSNTPINIVNDLNNLQPLWAFENLSKSNKI